MADYYWIGAGSTFAYDETDGMGNYINWATTSGGSTYPTSAPGGSDSLHFDSNSGANNPSTLPSTVDSLDNTGSSVTLTYAAQTGSSLEVLTQLIWENGQWFGTAHGSTVVFNGTGQNAGFISNATFNDAASSGGGSIQGATIWNSTGSGINTSAFVSTNELAGTVQAFTDLTIGNVSTIGGVVIYPQHHAVTIVYETSANSQVQIDNSQLPIPSAGDLRYGTVVDAVTGTLKTGQGINGSSILGMAL